MKRHFSTAEVMQIISGMGEHTVRELLDTGVVKGFKRGGRGRYQFSRLSLLRYLLDNQMGTAPLFRIDRLQLCLIDDDPARHEALVAAIADNPLFAALDVRPDPVALEPKIPSIDADVILINVGAKGCDPGRLIRIIRMDHYLHDVFLAFLVPDVAEGAAKLAKHSRIIVGDNADGVEVLTAIQQVLVKD